MKKFGAAKFGLGANQFVNLEESLKIIVRQSQLTIQTKTCVAEVPLIYEEKPANVCKRKN